MSNESCVCAHAHDFPPHPPAAGGTLPAAAETSFRACAHTHAPDPLAGPVAMLMSPVGAHVPEGEYDRWAVLAQQAFKCRVTFDRMSGRIRTATVEALPDPRPAAVRLRKLLKIALRNHGLRARWPQPQPPAQTGKE